MKPKIAQFIKMIVEDGPFKGCDLDGGWVQELAEKLGIIKIEQFDRFVHGDPEYGQEDGDPWLVFTPGFKAALAKEEGP